MKDAAFWSWLEAHGAARGQRSLTDLVSEAGGGERCAVVGVDLIEGFCRLGPLQSPRVTALLDPAAQFLTRCYEAGVRDFLFPCDAHQADSPEFASFPPHCVVGTAESELVRELASLPFSHLFERFDKRSVCSLTETNLAMRLQGDQIQKIICIGDCTDLCLYHVATGLKFLANSSGLPWEVVVPANLVATYDLPVETALSLGALPHPGDLLHDLFLYHLQLNGVNVVASLD